MTLRHHFCQLLLPAALVIGFITASAVRADIPPFPPPQPNPPQPQPPQPSPPPDPAPDDGESQVRPVVIATAASLGVTLLGVWVIRRQFRRFRSESPSPVARCQ